MAAVADHLSLDEPWPIGIIKPSLALSRYWGTPYRT